MRSRQLPEVRPKKRPAAVPSARPLPRVYPGMVYEPTTKTILLFGGQGERGACYDDLWVLALEKGTWLRISRPPNVPWPSVRYSFGFAAGSNGSVYVLGGYDGQRCLGDLWEFNLQASSWKQHHPVTHLSWWPAARYQSSMAIDPERKRLVLFGGATMTTTGLADTSEWNLESGVWKRFYPRKRPTPRNGHTLTYHRGRSSVVLVAGRSPDGSILDDTWFWDGGAAEWADLRLLGPSSGVTDHATAYDASAERLILYGGQFNGPGYASGPYEWPANAPRWGFLKTDEGPGERLAPGLVCMDDGRLILFGGSTVFGHRDDTWILTGTPPVWTSFDSA